MAYIKNRHKAVVGVAILDETSGEYQTRARRRRHRNDGTSVASVDMAGHRSLEMRPNVRMISTNVSFVRRVERKSRNENCSCPIGRVGRPNYFPCFVQLFVRTTERKLLEKCYSDGTRIWTNIF